MKKLIFTVALLAIAGTFSYAQSTSNTAATAPAPAANVDRGPMIRDIQNTTEAETNKLDKDLHFTHNQKNAMNGIGIKFGMLAQTQEKNATPERKAELQKMKLDAIQRELTPEQFQKYKALTK